MNDLGISGNAMRTLLGKRTRTRTRTRTRCNSITLRAARASFKPRCAGRDHEETIRFSPNRIVSQFQKLKRACPPIQRGREYVP
jgi:hypothetical protein